MSDTFAGRVTGQQPPAPSLTHTVNRFCGLISAFLLAVLFLPVASSAAEQAETDAVVEKIQKAYEGITDLSGSFIQKNVIRELKKTDTYKGTFSIKRPMKMKWAYTGKAAQDITINNETVTLYRKGDPQAYRSKFDKASYGQTPVALLSGFGDLRKEFLITGRDNSLVLRPKSPMSNIATITLNVDTADEETFPIRSFVIRDTRQNVVEIELRDVKTNTGLKDSAFVPSLPKDVTVLEQ